MKIHFIINPVAGNGKAKTLVPTIKKICNDKDIDFTISTTVNKGDGTIIAKKAANSGYSKIVAVGGDGTINEVVNGIYGTDSSLGVLPAGSGNDFFRSIHRGGSTESIICDIINGQTKRIDLGKCNEKYFINVASVGLDAVVVDNTSKTKKLFRGTPAYIASAIYSLFEYRGWDVEIHIDKRVENSKVLLAAIANGMYYGGGFLPAPDAQLNDGLFDICYVAYLPRRRIVPLLPKYMKGKHTNRKEVKMIRAKNLSFLSESPLTINYDGEIFHDCKATFQIIPDGINVISSL